MEFTLSTTTLLSVSKTLNPSFFSSLRRRLYSQCILHPQLLYRSTHGNFHDSIPSSSLMTLRTGLVPPVGFRFSCYSSSVDSLAFAAGGDGGESGGFGGGGGGGKSDGGDSKTNSVTGGAEEVSALSPDVIILDVGGMTCGGCAASVRRILESQPQVSSANVNLTTETAIVWPISEAKVIPNWQKELGEALAKHLTSCGFNSNLRGQGAIEGEIPS